MVEWIYEYGDDTSSPEIHWPVRRLKVKKLARTLLQLDPEFVPLEGPQGDVELHHQDKRLGVITYLHSRGVIIFFPYMAYSVYSRAVLGICFTYIRLLAQLGNFWCYDPQLNAIFPAEQPDAIDLVARMMDASLPKQMQQPTHYTLPDTFESG